MSVTLPSKLGLPIPRATLARSDQKAAAASASRSPGAARKPKEDGNS